MTPSTLLKKNPSLLVNWDALYKAHLEGESTPSYRH